MTNKLVTIIIMARLHEQRSRRRQSMLTAGTFVVDKVDVGQAGMVAVEGLDRV